MRRVAAYSILALTLAPLPAFAHWPMQRHDPARTGATNTPSDLQRPAVTWRQYLGGSVPAAGLVAADVDGDGDTEVVFISGGKLVAKKADDRLVWETQPLALNRITAIVDLDGDGTQDVVAVGAGLVAVLSLRTGALEWRTDLTTFGVAIGSARVGHFGTHPLPSLYVGDTACGDSGTGNHVSVAYNFAGGFGAGVDDGSKRIWVMEPGHRDYWCANNDVVADLDGDGHDEVLAFGSTALFLYDGATGQLISSGDSTVSGGFPLGFSLPWGLATSDALDVDADGRIDVVAYSDNRTDPSISSRATFVVSYDPTRTDPATRLYLRWSHRVTDPAADSHPFVQNGAADFDGDGHYEIADAFIEGGVLTGYVFDAATGQPKLTLPGVSPLGVYDLGNGTRPTLLVRRGTALEGYRFAGFGEAAAPAPDFTLPDAAPLFYVDLARQGRQSATSVPLTGPVPGSTRRALVLVDGQTLRAVDVGVSPPATVGTLDLPPGVAPVATAPEQNVAAPAPGVLLARSDGYLVVLDAMLATINFGNRGDVPLPGIRTGGYYSGPRAFGPVPVAGRMGGAADDVVVADSLNLIHRLDVSNASLVRAPLDRWTPFAASFPALDDEDGDGVAEGVVVVQRGAIELRAADGTTVRWNTLPGGATEIAATDPVPLHRTGGGNRWAALVVDTGSGATRAGAVQDGVPVWESGPPAPQLGGCSGALGVDDVDGDGNDDAMLVLQSALKVLSGADGTALAPDSASCTLIPMSVRGRAGSVTAVINGTYAPLAGVTLAPGTAPTVVWQLPATVDEGYSIPAAVQCPGKLALGASRKSSSHFFVVDAATGAMSAELILAGGRAFASAADADAAGALQGQLGDTTATVALWANQPAMLVGSTDGHLYAIDPCGTAPALLWSLDFRAPVGEAILSDTDGDGQDEIVVTAADGFLYGVDTERFPPPAWVNDVDPAIQGSTDDVDVTRGDRIAAAWADVPGATGYEWAVFTPGGTSVSRNPDDPSNPFSPVAATVHRAQFGTGLVDGSHYCFAVRAVGSTGASPETLSDCTQFVMAAVTRDAGAGDAGGTPDATAGTDGGVDASALADAADAGSDGGTMTPHGGCGCRAPMSHGRARGVLGVALAGLAVAVFARRRRDNVRPGR